ncbi:MAG: putative DNA binding domain-containing protein [Oscillospiraceae bacterium]|nr:putative DNA binding domain-containing protein [Oscillospiraceae bacterium]
MENLDKLVNELRKLPTEPPWVEFKHDNYDPNMIGCDISALANSAALHEKSCAYMIWGIDDKTHDIVGTNYNLQTLKKGNQEIENWLRFLLSKNADFEFHAVSMENVTVGVLIIYRATNQTVLFEKVDYIRIGSYTKKLNEYPQIQAQLWDRLRNSSFEERSARHDLELSGALRLLDYSAYFDLLEIPVPTDIAGIEHYMAEEGILIKQDNGLYSITNLGAILFAKRLSDFSRISRKAVRVVQYRGNSRLDMLKEDVINTGYAVGFTGLIKFIEALIPTQEYITPALRETRTAYPLVAIREAVANALIHQDFSVMGTSPVIEIFDNRIEITNSGTPLVDIRRIIDNPPKSRNEKLAALMRRLRMCEELGTGWDRIVITCELFRLPAPKIELYEDSTRVTLFSEMPFSNISMEDKLWACYLHACVKQVEGEQLTNSSLRERFGLKESSSGSVSRLIKEAVTLNFIKPLDPTTAPRYMKYIPIWA